MALKSDYDSLLNAYTITNMKNEEIVLKTVKIKEEYDIKQHILNNILQCCVFNDPSHSDFYVYDDSGTKVYLHKLVLYRTSYFKTFFESNIQSDKSNMKVSDVYIAQCVLSLLYKTNQIKVFKCSLDQHMDMILYSNMLEMDNITHRLVDMLMTRLKTRIEKKKTISISSFCNLLSYASSILPDDIVLVLHRMESA